MSDNEDDLPHLSAETFAALQEFYNEQSEKEAQINSLAAKASDCVTIDENWQLSQFWYDNKTIDVLVEATSKAVSKNAKVALISCPTLYKKMKESKAVDEVTLFEYDQRFAVYGPDFIPYDYKSPLDVPRDLANHYDIVIADPPFLSDECLTKVAVTVKFLTKHKIIICTGDVMTDLIERLLDAKKCVFKPGHVQNLANEFSCFANFNFDLLVC